MTAAGFAAFNLLVNGVGSFAFAWLLSRLSLRVFRPRPGRAYLALLSLPFLKLGFDLTRGIPAGSFLWLRAAGAHQDLGSFQVGLGIGSWGIPRIVLTLGALSGGRQYTQSAADVLAALLAKRVSPLAPTVIAAALLAVSATRLSRRALAWRRAAAEQRDVKREATRVGWKRVGLRRVPLFVAAELSGSPFTGGIVAPYVCFPEHVWRALPPEERRAALAHELAHAAGHHVLFMAVAGIVRDVFWFVPFVGAAERRLRDACELSADARAAARCSTPAVLASALVRVGEAMRLPAPARAGTFATNEGALHSRIDRLLDPPPPPRFGFQRPLLRALWTLWIAGAVLVAVAFGNH
jgi:Zn-dependent protease with chaperone function